jgi:hypothetical protein
MSTEQGAPLSRWLLYVAAASLFVVTIADVHWPRDAPQGPNGIHSHLLLRQPNASEPAQVTSAWNPSTLFQEIDRHFAQLSPGKAVFTVPPEMRVGDARNVAFRIARVGDEREILKALPPGMVQQWQQAHITPTMKARLNGADFDIKSESSEEQVVGGGSYTQWDWLVTPQASGKKELTLHVVAVVTVSGYEKPRDVLVASRRVLVRVNPRLLMLTFVEAHWGSALAFLIGVAAHALWQWIREKIGKRRKGDSAGFV